MSEFSDFYVFAIPAVLIAGISKGGFGGGIGMVSTPLLAMSVSPLQAAAIMLPILIVMDILGLIAYRRKVDWQIIRTMVPGAVIGILLGWYTATYVSEEAIRFLVGVIAVSFALSQIIAEMRNVHRTGRNRFAANFWGLVAGYTSFVSHAGGPPYQAYSVKLKLEPVLYAGTSVVFFSIVNAVKVVPYFALGQFSTENLSQSAVLLPIAAIGILAGIWLVKRVNRELFYRITYAAMLLIGCKLIWDGASAIM